MSTKKEKSVYKRYPRRNLSGGSITTPDASLSVRYLIDRTAKGLPVNARLSKHIPLPPDGMLLDDFETGIEEILDVTDAQAFADKLQAQAKYIADEKEKARKQAIEATETAPPVSDEVQ